MDKCISAIHLARWIEGSLGDADQESVARHLSHCDECRRAIGLTIIVEGSPCAALTPVEHARALAAVLGPGTVCADVNLWSRWVEETVADADRETINSHLAECDDCRRTVALARIATQTPAPNLTDTARRRVETLVMPRKRLAWAWQVAAAAAVFFCVAIYFMLRSSPPPADVTKTPEKSAPSATITPDRTETPKPEPKPEQPKSETPAPEPKNDVPKKETPKIAKEPGDPAPVMPDEKKPVVRPDMPKLFAKISVSEPRGLSIQRAGQKTAEKFSTSASLTYEDVLIAENGGAVTVDGCALVMLDRNSRISLMTSTSSASYVMQIHAGVALIDTIGGEQEWDVWYQDASVSLTKMKGRVAVDSSKSVLSLGLVSGSALARTGKAAAVSVEAGSLMTLTDLGLVSAGRMNGAPMKTQGETVTLFTCDFGKETCKVVSGTVKTEKPGFLEAGSGGPTTEMIWAGVKFARPIVYDGGLMITIRFRSSTGALALHAEGFARPMGRHGSEKDWSEIEMPLHGFQKDLTDMEFGTALNGISIGILKGEWLQIDSLRITKRIE